MIIPIDSHILITLPVAHEVEINSCYLSLDLKSQHLVLQQKYNGTSTGHESNHSSKVAGTNHAGMSNQRGRSRKHDIDVHIEAFLKDQDGGIPGCKKWIIENALVCLHMLNTFTGDRV